MEDVCHGIATAQVMYLDGEWEDVAHLVQAQPHELFSPLRMDLSRVAAVLTAKRWDGVVPLVVFLGCDTWARELSVLIRERQPKQAVLVIATDTSRKGPLHTMGTHLTTSRRPHKQSLSQLIRDGRYRDVSDMTDLETLCTQLHAASADVGQLSDMDLLLHHVPPEVVEAGLPVVPPQFVYQSSQRQTKLLQSNDTFLKVVQPLVAYRVGTLLSLHAMLDYTRFAHQILVRPDFVQSPRDAADPGVSQVLNDRLLILATAFAGIEPRNLPEISLDRGVPRAQNAPTKTQCPSQSMNTRQSGVSTSMPSRPPKRHCPH